MKVCLGFALLLLLWGCTATKPALESATWEQNILAKSYTAAELGLELVPGGDGQTVRWREIISPRTAVTLPMLSPETRHSRQPRIEAKINGRAKSVFAIDSGAPLTSLKLDEALEAEVKVADPEEFKNTFQGIAGTEENYYGMMDLLEVSTLTFSNVFCLLRPTTLATNEVRLDNLLGMASLAKLAWFGLDFPQRQVTLSPDPPAPTPERLAGSFPFELTGMQMRTEVVVNEEFQFWVMIDTGNDAAVMLPHSLIEQVGLSKEAERGKKEVYGGIGGTIETRRFKLSRLRIGEVTFEEVNAVAVPDEFPPSIGSDLLDEYHVVVNLVQKRIYLGLPVGEQ